MVRVHLPSDVWIKLGRTEGTVPRYGENVGGAPVRRRKEETPETIEEEKGWRRRAAQHVDEAVQMLINEGPNATILIASDASVIERKNLKNNIAALHAWDTGSSPSTGGAWACWILSKGEIMRGTTQPYRTGRWCAHRWAHTFAAEQRSGKEGVETLEQDPRIKRLLKNGANVLRQLGVTFNPAQQMHHLHVTEMHLG